MRRAAIEDQDGTPPAGADPLLHRRPPGDQSACQAIDAAVAGIKAEVIFELVPEEFADLRPFSPVVQPAQQGRDQAVVLIRYEVRHADRVPLVEQGPEARWPVALVHPAIVPGGQFMGEAL